MDKEDLFQDLLKLNTYPLHYLVSYDAVEHIIYFRKHHMFIYNECLKHRQGGRTPFIAAIDDHRWASAKMMLLGDNKIATDRNKYLGTALDLACQNCCSLQNIDFLLSYGCNVNCVHPSTLHSPVVRSMYLFKRSLFKRLLQWGADPPLLIFATEGHLVTCMQGNTRYAQYNAGCGFAKNIMQIVLC